MNECRKEFENGVWKGWKEEDVGKNKKRKESNSLTTTFNGGEKQRDWERNYTNFWTLCPYDIYTSNIFKQTISHAHTHTHLFSFHLQILFLSKICLF